MYARDTLGEKMEFRIDDVNGYLSFTTEQASTVVLLKTVGPQNSVAKGDFLLSEQYTSS